MIPPPNTQTHTHTHFSGEWENWFTKNQYIGGIVHKRRGRGPGQFAKLMRARKKGIDIPMHTIVNLCSFSGFLRFGYMPEC